MCSNPWRKRKVIDVVWCVEGDRTGERTEVWEWEWSRVVAVVKEVRVRDLYKAGVALEGRNVVCWSCVTV